MLFPNGIPKSGTYLINKIIEYIDKWEDIKIHINPWHWDMTHDPKKHIINDCLAKYAVKKLQNGQFVAAHLPWSKGLERNIKLITHRRRIKHILIYRDPRDTFISYMNFVTYSNKYDGTLGARKRTKFMLENFSNDDDRLTYFIEKRRKYFFLEYVRWFNSPYCYAIKFEDLFLDIKKSRDGVFGKALSNLFEYLEIDPTSVDLRNFYSNVYGKGMTASSEEKKIGQYKRVYKDQHYKLLDNPDFRNILNKLGYKW